MTFVVIIDSQISWRYISYFYYSLHHSYLLHEFDIVTDFIILRAHHVLQILALAYLVFLYSLGIFIYSLPLLYMLQDQRSDIAGSGFV